uniref:Uncharacterized protein n=1 Tax=Salix viminalis TaxID=40686 RepID=A0A6N2L5H9_SALVM
MDNIGTFTAIAVCLHPKILYHYVPAASIHFVSVRFEQPKFYGKRIPHWLGVRLFCFQVNDPMASDICIDWKQIIGIDYQLVKQSFTAMELVLFLGKSRKT